VVWSAACLGLLLGPTHLSSICGQCRAPGGRISQCIYIGAPLCVGSITAEAELHLAKPIRGENDRARGEGFRAMAFSSAAPSSRSVVLAGAVMLLLAAMGAEAEMRRYQFDVS
jgi:hypothetical protein